MARRLPPLKALPDFEAAARHLSFTKAAAELHVTHGAVSRQVKALEEALGVKLFRRLNRALRLTDEGQAYVGTVRELLERLAETGERLRAREEKGGLTVSTTYSFTTKWLMPRLMRFRERHPEIDVRLQANDQLVDFAREEVDLVIRYGGGRYAGLAAEQLTTDDYVPVCSPALLGGAHPLRKPADLRHHVLLHEEDALRQDIPGEPAAVGWRLWLKAAGVDGVDAGRGPIFSHSSMVLEAAINGEGVALGRTALIGDDLAAGRLVKPFALELKVSLAYYIVYPPRRLERPKVRAFRDWLHEEAAKDAADLPARQPPAQSAGQAAGGG
ncbi:MAG: transcriptional regulator GcvA [Alphaproteobacteria bacterium]